MKKTRLFQIIMGVLFLFSTILMLFPIVRVVTLEMSVKDLLTLTEDMERITKFGLIVTQFNNYISQFKWTLYILMGLPILAAVLVMVLKAKMAVVVGITSIVIDNIMMFRFVLKLDEPLQNLKKYVDIFGSSSDIGIVKSTIIFWIVSNLIIVFIVVMICKELLGANQTEERGTIMQEHIQPIPLSKIKNHPQNVMQPKRENTIKYDGAILGKSGIYNQKVFMLNPKEKVMVGNHNTQSQIILEGLENEECCSIQYDVNRQEYWVQASQKKSVYLESGQPLGANRRYFLARGTSIMMKGRENSFELK